MQSEAKSDLRAGGAFSMFNGTVSGTYREVDPPKRIVQDWRFNHWPEGCLSKVGRARELVHAKQRNMGARVSNCHACRRLSTVVVLLRMRCASQLAPCGRKLEHTVAVCSPAAELGSSA